MLEINNQSDMAKLLQALISGEDNDAVFDYELNLEIDECVVNTFSVRDKKTGKSYIVNVKMVK